MTSKMMLQLRPGMTKSQVRFIMGTPLIQDSFHKNRWDYFYQMRKGGKIIEQRRVILEFDNDALKSVRGDVIPAAPGETSVEAPPAAPIIVEPKAPEKKGGLLDALMFWKSDEKKAEEAAEKPAPAPEKPTTVLSKDNAKEPTKVVPELISPEASPSPAVPAAKPAGRSNPAPVDPAASGASPTKPAPAEEVDEDDLPPEDEPGYFERMLEKIGF
ncbi:outer membrane protein assembly factor BamE [Methylobacillus caricis]|uniref:outer membrane protein assembly factor BamE n=1 Tax=Methylobacillus caricis TaxID=1971611 RepID=UPI00299EF7BB|nr:outer membrane protein assembly factor BamE [Methylobacillus caricis]